MASFINVCDCTWPGNINAVLRLAYDAVSLIVPEISEIPVIDISSPLNEASAPYAESPSDRDLLNFPAPFCDFLDFLVLITWLNLPSLNPALNDFCIQLQIMHKK